MDTTETVAKALFEHANGQPFDKASEAVRETFRELAEVGLKAAGLPVERGGNVVTLGADLARELLEQAEQAGELSAEQADVARAALGGVLPEHEADPRDPMPPLSDEAYPKDAKPLKGSSKGGSSKS